MKTLGHKNDISDKGNNGSTKNLMTTANLLENKEPIVNVNEIKRTIKFLTEEFYNFFNTLKNSDVEKDLSSWRVHSILKNFEYFRLFPSALISSIYQKSHLVTRLEKQISILEKALIFFSSAESENLGPTSLINKMANNVGVDPSDIFIKTMSELQTLITHHSLPNKVPYANLKGYFQRLLINVYGISPPSNNPDKFPLHKAVFQSNLPLIRRLCIQEHPPFQYHPVDQSDLLGVTPLMLAVKLNRKDAVFILCEHGADPKLRTHPLARTPMEEAVLMKSQTILKYLINASHRGKQIQWETQKANISAALRTFPDLSCEMTCEFDSKFVPFVKKFTPFYKYKIKKQKSNLRIDIHLGKGQHNQNEMSAYFSGEGTGDLTLLLHSKNKCIDLLSDLTQAQLDENCQQLLSKTGSSSNNLKEEIKFENFRVSPAVNWRGNIIHEKIGSRQTTKYSIKGEVEAFSLRKDFLNEIAWKDLRSFEDYHELMIKLAFFSEVFDAEAGEILEPVTLFSKVFAKEQNVATLKKGLEIAKTGDKRKAFINTRIKSINADVWFCEELPLKINHLIPILEVLGYFSTNMGHFKEFIMSESFIQMNAFPIKAVIPLYYTLNTTISFTDFSFLPLDPAHFIIDLPLKQDNQSGMITPRLKTEEIHALSKNIANSLLKNSDAASQLTDSQNYLNQQWENFLKGKDNEEHQYKVSESDDSFDDAKRRYEFLLESRKSAGSNNDLFDIFKDEGDVPDGDGLNVNNDECFTNDSPQLDFSEKKKNVKPSVPSFDTKNLKGLDDKFLKKQMCIKGGIEKIVKLREENNDRNLTNKIKETREIKPFTDMNTPRSHANQHQGRGSPQSKENKISWGLFKDRNNSLNDPFRVNECIKPMQCAPEEEIIQIKHQNLEMINNENFLIRMTNIFESASKIGLSQEVKTKNEDTAPNLVDTEPKFQSNNNFPEEKKNKPNEKVFPLRHKLRDVDLTLSSFKRSNKK